MAPSALLTPQADIPDLATTDDEFDLNLLIIGNGDDDDNGTAECGSCDTSDGCSSTCPSACVSAG